MASGVSTGKICSRNWRVHQLAGGGRLLAGDDPDAVLGQVGKDHVAELTGLAAVELGYPLGDARQDLIRRQAVGATGVDPGVDLVVHPGNPDHEELVQVGGEDRQELDPFHQRQRLVLGQLEHAVVEVEPGQFTVQVERGVGQVRDGRGRGRLSVCLAVRGVFGF